MTCMGSVGIDEQSMT